MFEWAKLFPPYLIVLTILFVIVPTLVAALLRISLFLYLSNSADKVNRLLIPGKSRGQQPKIVEELEERYKQAIHQLEQVNTAALIDGIYSQGEFRFLGLPLRCEQGDNFCKVLPNLLLAFGLLGTFLGITLNLYNLSETISQTDIDINSLIQKLQLPLESMGIAFITSLIGLLCSSFLVVINVRFNTNLAKYRLISSLEDYLDNIFKPQEQGDTRLDKAVNKMVEQQHEFLTRFHEKVGQVLESTLGRTAEKMARENEKANLLARLVYEKLSETSSSLNKGATTFQDAVSSLERQIKIVTEISPNFQKYTQSLEKSTLILREASERIERSKFSENLENLTVNLAVTQKEFSHSTSLFADYMGQFIEGNNKATDLAERVYTNFQDSSVKLQQSSISFIEASETIERSQFANKLSTAASDLAIMQGQFADSTVKLQQSSISFIEASEKIERSQFANKLSTAASDLAVMQGQFAQSVFILNQSTQSIESAMSAMGDLMHKMIDISDKIGNSNQQLNQIIQLAQTSLINEQNGLSSIHIQLDNLFKTMKGTSQNERSDELEKEINMDDKLAQLKKEIRKNIPFDHLP